MSTINEHAEALHTEASKLDAIYQKNWDTPVADYLMDRIVKLRERAYALEDAERFAFACVGSTPEGQVTK